MVSSQKKKSEFKDALKLNWHKFIYQLNEASRVKGSDKALKNASTFELIVVKEGSGVLEFNNEKIILRAHDIFIIHPSNVYGIHTKKNRHIDYYLFTFEIFTHIEAEKNTLFTPLQQYSLFPLKKKCTVKEFSKVLEISESINLLADNNDGFSSFNKRILFEQIIFLIIRNLKLPVLKDTFCAIEEVKAYIDQHFRENESITIDLLAEMAGISPKYFSALFKKEMGISVSEYVTNLRINVVKQLLTNNDEKLRDIANKVGYSDEFYLSRKFKQVVGISPSAYRKKRKRKIAAYDLSSIGHLHALNICLYAAPIHPKWTSYYFQELRDEIQVHLSAYQINKDWRENIQTLAQFSPEVIISKDSISDAEKEELERIAPVFYYHHELNWRKQFLLIAQYLGEEQEAIEWLKKYEKKANYIRIKLKDFYKDEIFFPLRLYRGVLYGDYSRTMCEVFFEDLQMKSCNLCCENLLKNKEVSLAELSSVNPNRILLNICQETITMDGYQSLQTDITWNNLKAVRLNQVYRISSDPWREYSASAHERILDSIVEFLSGKNPK